MDADTTTVDQRAYFHTLRFLVAEAERPRDGVEMKQVLYRLYGEARRKAKLKRVSWEQWQVRQEQFLIDLMDEQCVPVPEDLRMAADA